MAKFFQKLEDPGENLAAATGEFMREEMNVGIEKSRDLNRRRFEPVLLQDVFDNVRIGHPRDLQIGQVILDLKALVQCAAKREDAGVPGMNERAVDVEEEKAFVH